MDATITMTAPANRDMTEATLTLTADDRLVLDITAGDGEGARYAQALDGFYAAILRRWLADPATLRMADATADVGAGCLWLWSDDPRDEGTLLAVNWAVPAFTELGHRASAYGRGMGATGHRAA